MSAKERGLKAEADGVSSKGHRSLNRTNPYFTKDDPELPTEDPRRAFFDRSNNFIAADNFSITGPLRTIHNFPAFDPFIQDCLEEDEFFRYADPLASPERCLLLYGRALPIHYERAGLRADNFID